MEIIWLIWWLSILFYSNAAPLAGTDPHYLQEMELSMSTILKEYVAVERNKLDLLLAHAESLEARSKGHSAKENNPITLYRKAESLIEEWRSLHDIMNSSYLPAILERYPPVPKLTDLGEIATAIFRLQDVYLFTETDVAGGSVQGLDAGNFSARDCFNLGGIAFAREDHYHALTWFQEGRRRVQHENPPSIYEFELTALLAISLAKKGNEKWAKHIAKEFGRKALATGERFWELLDTYPQLKSLLTDAQAQELEEDELPAVRNERLDWYDTTEQPRYEFLCRQEYKKQIPLSNLSFNCYYDRRFPDLFLAPAKVEPLRKDPPVVIYRNIISDEEIEVIKAIVREKMEKSRVVETTTNGIVLTSARESFTGWLKDSDHPVVKAVRKRVGRATNLDMETAEDLQVSQYGIGGHYGPHYDHATKRDRAKPGYRGSYHETTGDRIATLMFYLAEPEFGGGTAFPYADLVVKPTKNDAIFWFNIRPNGDGDDNTLHAGCPVVSGAKWVANQWIKERGQEFRRQCGVSANE